VTDEQRDAYARLGDSVPSSGDFTTTFMARISSPGPRQSRRIKPRMEPSGTRHDVCDRRDIDRHP
jgi:hypothetical protein